MLKSVTEPVPVIEAFADPTKVVLHTFPALEKSSTPLLTMLPLSVNVWVVADPTADMSHAAEVAIVMLPITENDCAAPALNRNVPPRTERFPPTSRLLAEA